MVVGTTITNTPESVPVDLSGKKTVTNKSLFVGGVCAFEGETRTSISSHPEVRSYWRMSVVTAESVSLYESGFQFTAAGRFRMFKLLWAFHSVQE